MNTISSLPQPSRRGRFFLKLFMVISLVGYGYHTVLSTFGDRYSLSHNHDRQASVEDGLLRRSDQNQTISESQKRGPFHLEVQDPMRASHDLASSDSLTQALGHVFSVLPDDSHGEYLISAIEGTGEEKLRELGSRARAFKVLFEAWESLHLTSAREQIFVRENLIQHLRSHPELAYDLGMDHVRMLHAYEEYRYLITHLSMTLFSWTVPCFADHVAMHTQFWDGGRGIVFTAGDRQAPYLLTSIQSIRKLGCDLPIEVMYLGDDDLDENHRDELESIPGVITRDLSFMVNDEGWRLRGWAAKPFAILLSSFREAILIDADALFLQDPAVLFQDPGYQGTGALFFKDRLFMPQSKKAWLRQILPSPISKQARRSRFWTGESGHMQESGVVVVDKWKHFVPLLLVTRMNGPDRDGNKAEGRVGVYDMVFGNPYTHPSKGNNA